ncbi:MAG: hypothetical protein Q9216_003630, partial [Gyalolechia sp. 2 TL-2023]
MAFITTLPTSNPTPTTFTDANGNPIKTYAPTATDSMDAHSQLPTPNPSEYYDPTSTDPFSPFYSHARASESSRRLHPIPSSYANNEKGDLEKGITIHTNPVRSTQSLPSHPANNSNKPSLLCKSEARNNQRRGGCFPGLSKNQRIA